MIPLLAKRDEETFVQMEVLKHMDVNFYMVVAIAIIMMLIYGFLDALRLQMTTGIWDYGYLGATFVYSLIVGLVVGTTGMVDLSMPLSEWMPVLMGTWAAYLGYLAIIHTVSDYIISKIFPAAPQGLSTPMLAKQTKFELALKR